MGVFFLAIAAGFLTVLAPCILPVLPLILGTSGGKSKWRPVTIIIGFVGSFSVIGAAIATAGSFLGISNEALRYSAVILLMLFGLALLFENVYERIGAAVQPALARLSARVSRGSVARGDALSGLLVGVSLGLIWTPCAGPILGTILTLAAKTKDFVITMLLMFAYALGAGIPMLGIAYGSRALQARIQKIGKYRRAVDVVFGLLIISTALAILTGFDIRIQTWLIRFYPSGFTGTL